MERMADHETATIEIRGTALRLARGGAGAPLLFLHDATGAAPWQPFLDRLSARFAVVAPEHPGYGGDDPPPWLDRIADLANFYLDCLDALDLKRVHLVGSSLGGWIAAELATRNTNRLASLTLIDPLGLYLAGAVGIDPFVTNDEQSLRDLFVDGKIADATVARLLAPEAEDALLKNKMVTAKLAWQPRLHDPHLQKWLHRIDVPALIVWGESDRILPKAYAEAWRRAVPGAELAVLRNCGHLPHLEQPEETAATITDFIAGRRAS
jgi:pimeloyl-ACP methyl ester carboxylesterase